MEGFEIRKLIAKLTMYAFAGFLFFTYIQRNTPAGSFNQMSIFVFTFFLNFTTQWALCLMQGLAGKFMQFMLLFLQWGFFAWTFKNFLFVYDATLAWNERDYSTFLYTPLTQYAPIFGLFLIMLLFNAKER